MLQRSRPLQERREGDLAFRQIRPSVVLIDAVDQLSDDAGAGRDTHLDHD